MKTYIEIDKEACKGCLLCIPVCPKDVIEQISDINKKGWQVVAPTRNDDCIGCQKCTLICPDVAITLIKETD